MRHVILAGLALTALAVGAAPAAADDVAACEAARGAAAVKACGRLIARGGDDQFTGRVRFKRGLAHARSGDHRRALADFERASALMPGDADARKNVAAMKLRLGRTEEGKADLRREVARDPSDARTARSLRVIEALDDYDRQLERRQRELEAEMRRNRGR